MNSNASVTMNPDSQHMLNRRELLLPLQALATAQNKYALQNILDQHRDLLSPWADETLTQLIQTVWQHKQMDSLCVFIACRTFLTRYRQVGCYNALAEQQLYRPEPDQYHRKLPKLMPLAFYYSPYSD